MFNPALSIGTISVYLISQLKIPLRGGGEMKHAAVFINIAR
jgi:hypothetical protein